MLTKYYPSCKPLICIISALFICLLFSGCADLSAVREFAKTSAATADYKQIVADYVESPLRQKRYQPESQAAILDAIAKARADQKAMLEGAQAILVEYMSALGDLAADELPNVNLEIDSLSKALENAQFIGGADQAINKDTASAASAIAKVLSRAVLDHWRQSKISQLVKDTSYSVQVVVDGLRDIILNEFDASLNSEDIAIDKYYQKVIASSKELNISDAVEPLVNIIMDEQHIQLEIRRAKNKAYAEVLNNIGKGHAELRRKIDNLGSEALKEHLEQYSKDLQTLYNNILMISK